MTWGKGIALTIFVFVGSMSFLVYKCIGVKTDLVSSTYYENALDYDVVQNAKSNYSRLNSVVSITKNDQLVNIVIPNTDSSEVEEVRLELYYPSDKKNDQLVRADNSTIALNRSELQSGFYRVSLYWVTNGKDFLYEGSFIN